MKSSEVTVIDYGMGNLLSVRRAIEHCGAQVSLTSDPSVLAHARKIVLPGVGAFSSGMFALRQRGLDVAIRQAVARGVPLFGICLGMQMLLEKSEEFGVTEGLGLIPGRVVAIPKEGADGSPLKIPHIGWNELCLSAGRRNWSDFPLRPVDPGTPMYFVHSFMADHVDPSHRVADCIYGGKAICAAIARGIVFGCQFHPEKSGEAGLRILRDFVEGHA
jgi:glutamine amidotransferase